MLKTKSTFFSKFTLYVLSFALLCGCAAQQKPNGGPRDLTAPKVLKLTPEDMTRKFNAKQIRIDFDEYFKLSNQYQEISITPAQEKQPEYNIKQKSLIVEFKDTLLKNTTYVINFGKAIGDVNENNVLKNFTYVFSTGNHIDSLSITGNVTNSTTNEKEKDATVFLFSLKEDSLLFGKKKPTIFTTTDSAGNFSLNNLREDTYRIYALKETSPNKVFDQDNELIAFQKEPIKVNKDTTGVQLRLFKQTPEKYRTAENKFTPDGKLFIAFNKRVQAPNFKVLYPPAVDAQKIVEVTPGRDSAFLYFRNMDFDSLRVAINDGAKPLDTITRLKGRRESFAHAVTFSYNISRDDKLKPNTDLAITANMPIEAFDKSQIVLKEDSATVTNFTIQKDTASLRRYLLKYRFRAGAKYNLLLNEGAFTNIYGDKNKGTRQNFQADKQENYSQLTIKVTVPEQGKSYVVELMNEQKNVLRSDVITGNSSLVYKNYLTGKYRIRVIYDANKNGLWDSGNVRLRTYPENAWISPKEISLRPNWEAEETLEIPKE